MSTEVPDQLLYYSVQQKRSHELAYPPFLDRKRSAHEVFCTIFVLSTHVELRCRHESRTSDGCAAVSYANCTKFIVRVGVAGFFLDSHCVLVQFPIYRLIFQEANHFAN
jgi:hypothetical protein